MIGSAGIVKSWSREVEAHGFAGTKTVPLAYHSRMSRAWCAVGLALLVASGACKAAIGDAPGGRQGDPDAHGDDADRGGGGGSDASVPPDAPLGLFSTPQPIPTAATIAQEDDPVLSSDGLELVFARDSGGATGKDLFRATRATATDAFGAPAALTAFNTAGPEESPRLSADDLTLFWASNQDVMSASRTSTAAAFGPAAPVTFVNTNLYEKWFDACPNGYYLVTRANPPNGQDFFEGTVGTAPTGPVPELNSAANEISTSLSPDCLTLYFASNRAVGAANPVHIYMSTRASLGAKWSDPTVVDTFGTPTVDDEDLYLTANGHFAIFASTRGSSGTKDLFLSTR